MFLPRSSVRYIPCPGVVATGLGNRYVLIRYLCVFKTELIKKVWQRPTLPPKGSTIGAEGLNFRVRDGNGWFPFAVVTRLNIQFTVIS